MKNDHAVFLKQEANETIIKLSGIDGSYMGCTYDDRYYHHQFDLSPNDLLLLVMAQNWYTGSQSFTAFIIQETTTLSLRIIFTFERKTFPTSLPFFGHWGKFYNDERWFACATTSTWYTTENVEFIRYASFSG